MRKSTHCPEYVALCQWLTALRTAAGLSQRQLGAVLDVPHTWVAKVESGERRIDLIEFAWFCQGCGANPADEAARFLHEEMMPKPRRRGVSKTRGRR